MLPGIPLYFDAGKQYTGGRDFVLDYRLDESTGWDVLIRGSVFGTSIEPGLQWTPFCEKLFREVGANGIRLSDFKFAPDNSLDFINRLPGCARVEILGQSKIDLSPLKGNSKIVDIQIDQLGTTFEFDLSSLKALRRCHIPMISELASFLKCQQLVCLWLDGGKFKGTLDLTSLTELREFQCYLVRNLQGINFNPKVRLLSLELGYMKEFRSLTPIEGITKDLRYATLDNIPGLDMLWLATAEKIEGIDLFRSKIPSLNFLKGLKNLHGVCLFESKVLDGDLSLLDSFEDYQDDPRLLGTGKM
jgi:hypothetical protein